MLLASSRVSRLSVKMVHVFSPPLPASITIALLTHFTQAVKFLSTGSTVELNGVPYYVPPTSVGRLSIGPTLSNAIATSAGLLPLTIIKTNGSGYSSSDLQSTVDNFLSSDDVFQTDFLNGM